MATHNPTWCDLCGEMIWGLYSLGAWQCHLCSYTAHIKCRTRVTLDCSNHAKVEDVLEEVDEVRLADQCFQKLNKSWS